LIKTATKFGSIVAKLILLNTIYILVIVLSLTLLLGPATAAILKCLNELSKGDLDFKELFLDFFKTIKQKFKYSFLFGFVIVVLILLIVLNLYNYEIFGKFKDIIYISELIVLGVLLNYSITLFYLIGNYTFDSFKDLIENSFYFSMRYFYLNLIWIFASIVIVYLMVLLLNGFLLLALVSTDFLWLVYLYKPYVKKFEFESEENDDFEEYKFN
jgi:hypothetical protein